MKTLLKKSLYAVLGGTALIIGLARADGPPTSEVRQNGQNIGKVERNIVSALESRIAGLEASAALTLRDLKVRMPEADFSRTVIPLMQIVKDEGENPRVRVAAALALHELHTATGDFAISRAALFTDNHYVGHILSAIESHRIAEAESASLDQ